MQELMTMTFNGLENMPPADREKLAQMMREQADVIMVRGPSLGQNYSVNIMDNGDEFIKVEAQNG